MGYLKKSLRRINKILDDKELPENWNKFVEDSSKSENILVRTSKTTLYCTNCQKEYKYLRKSKNTSKCPFCHQELEVKNWNIRKVEYKKNLILLDKVDEEFIIRIFELKSEYKDKKWERSVAEYGRHFCIENVDLLRQNVCRTMGYTYVNHNENVKYSKNKWRIYSSYWKSLSTSGQVYHYNLKKIFKGTDYQYSQIWELAKKVDYFDLDKIMRTSSYYKSFELLVKLKLYNLSFDANKYDLTGNF